MSIGQGTSAFGFYPKFGWNADAAVATVHMLIQSPQSGPDFNRVVALNSSTLKNTNPTTWKVYASTPASQDPYILVLLLRLLTAPNGEGCAGLVRISTPLDL